MIAAGGAIRHHRPRDPDRHRTAAAASPANCCRPRASTPEISVATWTGALLVIVWGRIRESDGAGGGENRQQRNGASSSSKRNRRGVPCFWLPLPSISMPPHQRAGRRCWRWSCRDRNRGEWEVGVSGSERGDGTKETQHPRQLASPLQQQAAAAAKQHSQHSARSPLHLLRQAHRMVSIWAAAAKAEKMPIVSKGNEGWAASREACFEARSKHNAATNRLLTSPCLLCATFKSSQAPVNQARAYHTRSECF